MFWKTIHEYIDGYDLNITIRKNEDKTLTVIFVPKFSSDTDKKTKVSPLVITANADELDSDKLLKELKTSFKRTHEAAHSINVYEKSLKDAEQKKKDKLDKKKKVNPGKPEEKPEDKNQTKLI